MHAGDQAWFEQELAGCTFPELRQVYGIVVEVNGFAVQIVPRALTDQAALSVDAIVRDHDGSIVHHQTVVISDG
jgi:hypothetical protein